MDRRSTGSQMAKNSFASLSRFETMPMRPAMPVALHNLGLYSAIGTVRYFFVGDYCLKELLKRGVVKRRFGKEATPVAYIKEMECRAQEYINDNILRITAKSETSGTSAENIRPATTVSSANEINPPGYSAECYIIETKDEYHAFVAILPSVGPNRYWGYAMEVKHQSTLRRGGENELELEWSSTANPHALEHSMSKAIEMAYSRLQESALVPMTEHYLE